MQPLTDREWENYAAVDDALHTYPLEPAPDSILPAVMRRIASSQNLKLHSRLEWIDYTLSLFLAGMASLIFFFWSTFAPPTDWVAVLDGYMVVWWRQIWFSLRVYQVTIFVIVSLGLLIILATETVFSTTHVSYSQKTK